MLLPVGMAGPTLGKAIKRFPIRMKSPRPLLLASILLLLVLVPAGAIEKWLYCPTNLLVDKNVDALETLWRRASAAGFTQVLLSDSKFSRLEEMFSPNYPRYPKNVERVKQLAKELKLELVPAVFPIGYSNDLLNRDVNLIEAQPVKNVPLVVQGGVARLDDPAVPAFPEGGFSDLKKWGFHDESVVAENGAARVLEGKAGNARIFFKLPLQPWRQYHVSVRVKTRDFHGEPEIKVLADGGNGAGLQWNTLGVKATQEWTVHHAVFNSQKFTEATLIFGIWGVGGGSLWWDQPKIEPVAFLNLTRRPGTPLVVANAAGTPLVEDRDFEPLQDPLLGMAPYAGEYDTCHAPPQLKTKLPDGTKLRASYYHGATVNDHQAMICPSEPKTMELLRDQAQRMHRLWGAKGYFMSHDEIRVLNWCAACAKRQLTPGQMLADNVRACAKILRAVNPGGRIYVWSDMFDPNHNAVKGPYYLVNGPLLGSWEGLDRDVIVVPWYFEKRQESLKFFADRGHQQVIAGYYDAKPEQAAEWLAAARTVPGVLGIIYTTWKNDYRQLEKFSEVINQTK